jgi:hypothetical protein
MELGCVATVDRDGRTIFVADAHRGDGHASLFTLTKR